MEFFNFLEERHISQANYDAASLNEKIALMNIFSEFKRINTQSAPLLVSIVPNEKEVKDGSNYNSFENPQKRIAYPPSSKFISIVKFHSQEVLNDNKYQPPVPCPSNTDDNQFMSLIWSPDMSSSIEPDFAFSNDSSEIMVLSEGVFELFFEADWKADYIFLRLFINNQVALEYPVLKLNGKGNKERIQYLFQRGIHFKENDAIKIKGRTNVDGQFLSLVIKYFKL